MADIELVIKIPQELYDRATNGELTEIDSMFVCGSVANSTPLPKGHGRLIDADKIIKIITDVDGYERFENSNLFAKHYYDVVEDAPTIIEADKESEVQE